MRFQFTTKDMLWAISLAAVGIGALVWLSQQTVRGPDPPPIPLVIASWFGAPAFLGAGVLTPFHRPILGGSLGLIGQLVFSWYMVFIVGITARPTVSASSCAHCWAPDELLAQLD